jgi:hypothetical protein
LKSHETPVESPQLPLPPPWSQHKTRRKTKQRQKYQPRTPVEEDEDDEKLLHPLTTTIGQEEEATTPSTPSLPPLPP